MKEYSLGPLAKNIAKQNNVDYTNLKWPKRQIIRYSTIPRTRWIK